LIDVLLAVALQQKWNNFNVFARAEQFFSLVCVHQTPGFVQVLESFGNVIFLSSGLRKFVVVVGCRPAHKS